ncbi:metal-dependent hydrolase [Candidatus Woesearchaeota archaeon]|nr:metal-dependent hydrolase [Candidatus Woesearchaeota archaeon]MCF7900695.1 metal-dependent hydrolase [Candidatus Woesearchaeota archaeon]MCF8013216.1 metal-dependent hydrolase [Candidatus Woesearchaeota archaeon]
MHFLSHISYLYVLVNFFALIIGKTIPLEYNLTLLLFSVFPDFDYIVDFFYQKLKRKKYKVPDNHHSYASHWPIVYVPLIIIALITLDPFFIIVAVAIYFHLFMDLFFCNEGIMLLYPFSKKWFNFFSKKTAKKPGLDWNKAYSNLWIFKVDKIAFVIFAIHFIVVYLI